MELIRLFGNISKDDAPIAGGKGASLGEMTQAGIPVPPGFVVLSAAFERFLEETDLNVEINSILHKVNHKEIHTVENASETIRELILNVEMPKDIENEINRSFKVLNTQYVAVRSSATAEDGKDHAWAGQLESYLNTTGDDVLNKVKLCWSSLFTPRAIFYRFEKGLHTTKISVAVVIQKMVESEVSGIAFSVHPVTEDHNQLIIEAGFGLGEAIVSGSVTPDSYVVSKKPRTILDINISTQDRALYRSETVSAEHGRNKWRNIPEPKASSQVLTESQILELSEIILIIENHYGFPCDIEWAYETGVFYIVQSRPITTLASAQKESGDNKETVLEDITYNLKDSILTFSRPQSVLRDEIVYVLLEKYVDIPSPRVLTLPLEGTNRMAYIDSTFAKQLFDRMLDSVSTSGGVELHLENYEKAVEDFKRVGKEISDYTGSDKQELLRLFKKYLEVLPEMRDQVWMPWPLEKILVPKFIERLKAKYPHQWEEINHAVSSPVKLYGYQEMRLATCEAVINGQTESMELIEGLVSQYKWQGEYAYVEPLFEEDYFKTEFAKLTIEIAQQEKNRIVDDRERNKKNLERAMAQIEDGTLLVQARIINEYTFLRTDRVDLLKKLQVPVRGILERIAEHLARETGKSWTRIEVTSLLNSEIIDYLSGKFIPNMNSIVARGSGVYYRTRDEVKVITDIALVQKIKNEMAASADSSIKGTVAFKGKARGHVKMVLCKADLPKVLPGDILVSRTTMPDYTPAMEIASAFVTEEGGVTSHAAIIARELKKPCIVGTGNCTRILKDGDLVEVDADNGVVRIIQDGQGIVKNSEADLLYAGNTWFMTITRNMSFWHQYLSNEGHFRHTRDFGMDAELQVLHITKGGTETSLFMHNPNYNEYSEAVLEKVSTEGGIVDLKKKYHSYAQQLLSALDRIKNDLTVELLEDFFDAYRRFSAGLMITATLGRSGADKLTETLKVLGYTEEEIPQMNSLITYPQEHTPLFQSRLDLLKIGIAVQEKSLGGDALQKSLSHWLSEYGHIPVNFCEDPWSLDDARKQLDNLLREDCTEEYAKAEKNHKELTEKGKRLLEKIGDEKVSILSHAVAEGTYLNEFRKNVFSRVSLEYRGIFEEIAKQAGSGNWRDCFYLTPIEMLDILSGVNMDISSIVEEREIAGMHVDAEGMSHLLDKDAIDQFRSYILNIHGSSKENTHGDIIKGSSANRGKVTGTARLILSSKDFDKLSPGEILVTTMTSVDFVPVMGRAAAFVTNEGGITSHASIVAREMNKPCIIGTKNATQMIKDGDLVEVDADNGVVRILKKDKNQ